VRSVAYTLHINIAAAIDELKVPGIATSCPKRCILAALPAMGFGKYAAV